MKYVIQIVGVGGQGVLLASMVLGNAAMNAGHNVAMSEVHGMAQRGGSVLSTLRIGDDIISPLASEGEADMILGFEPAETCRNLTLGNKDSVIVMNMDPIYPSTVTAGLAQYPEVNDILSAMSKVTDRIMTIEATSIAEKAGKAVAANAVMIGAAAAAKGFPLSKDAVKRSLLGSVPEKFRDLNEKAFDMGYDAMKK
ncbi:MAG: indolepyruvate ferredoxin oxidoreductase subunit beta [Methanomassiliicoccaceae archaeon]|jgi:indolepyruvate ferredoxin oxidoreductase beta subunit|nr:indolepyruvate ferredoxin oxidoreductase subunit beta [Methanomassiliicoccaceae archaeon]